MDLMLSGPKKIKGNCKREYEEQYGAIDLRVFNRAWKGAIASVKETNPEIDWGKPGRPVLQKNPLDDREQ
ncbi:MAG: hypothetical protein HQL64_07975 [Magnetococcales bacterium]|nr:hypothetical protein [Magnetococcales bacterium]